MSRHLKLDTHVPPTPVDATPIKPGLQPTVVKKAGGTPAATSDLYAEGAGQAVPVRVMNTPLPPNVVRSLAESILAAEQQKAEAHAAEQTGSKPPPSLEAIERALQTGKKLPTTHGSYLAGVIHADGTIQTLQPEFAHLAQALVRRLAESGVEIPPGGVPLVIDRGDRVQLEELLRGEIISKLSVSAEMEYRDSPRAARLRDALEKVPWVGQGIASRLLGMQRMHGIEALPYPFFRAMVTGDTVPAGLRDVQQAVESAATYRVVSGSTGEAEVAFAKAFEAELAASGIKTRMTALDLAILNYAEQIDLKEIVQTLAVAGTVALGGEYLVHMGGAEGLIRFVQLSGVDAIDNVAAEMGMAKNELLANNATWKNAGEFMEKTLGADYKSLSAPDLMRRIATTPGPAGQILRRALMAALKGAAAGGVVNALYTSNALSNDNANPVALGAAGAVGSFTTSLGILYNTRATYAQVVAAGLVLYDEDRLPLPRDIYDTATQPKYVDGEVPQQVRSYIEEMARQEMTVRSGFWGSQIALPLTLAAGLILVAPVQPGQEQIRMSLYMTVAASSETILRGLFSAIRLGPQIRAARNELTAILAGNEAPELATAQVRGAVDHALAGSVGFQDHKVNVVEWINRLITVRERLPDSATRRVSDELEAAVAANPELLAQIEEAEKVPA